MTTDVVGNLTENLSSETAQKVAKARSLIMQGLGNQPLRLCLGTKDNPFRMWEIIQQRYALVNVATRVQLQ